ncbi:hypothetical protein [Kitasatospora sp. NPDC091276]|uniref:hypothetical protein n=1 Tax=Kitasatospora sp. NPDC091276 TaxID=3155300 RepID=UPI003440D6D2
MPPSSSSLHDFATWEPLLRLLRADHAQALAASGGEVAGLVGRQGWSVPVRIPRGLSAAAIEAPSDHDLRPIMALANELLTLWERPLITETVVEGDLGPLP